MGGLTPDAPDPALTRLFAMAYRDLIDDLHERLAARGWHDVRPSFGFALLAARSGPVQASALAGDIQEQGDTLSVEVHGFVPHCGGLAVLREPVVVLVSRDAVAAVQEIEPPTRKEK